MTGEPCAVCQDAEYGLLCGEDLYRIAARLCVRGGKRHVCGPDRDCRPYRGDSLARHLQSHGRDDLLPPGSQRRVTA